MSDLCPDMYSFTWLHKRISLLLYSWSQTKLIVCTTLLPTHPVYCTSLYQATNHPCGQLQTSSASISQGAQKHFLLLNARRRLALTCDSIEKSLFIYLKDRHSFTSPCHDLLSAWLKTDILNKCQFFTPITIRSKINMLTFRFALELQKKRNRRSTSVCASCCRIVCLVGTGNWGIVFFLLQTHDCTARKRTPCGCMGSGWIWKSRGEYDKHD